MRASPETRLLDLTTEIVAAYVAHNALASADLPGFMRDVHAALRSIGAIQGPRTLVELVPAVPVKKSVTPDFIVCLEDGKKFKSLKRHLATHFKLTPAEYRAKWNLPLDYPMTAPNYSARRSALARDAALGRKAEDTISITETAPARRKTLGLKFS